MTGFTTPKPAISWWSQLLIHVLKIPKVPAGSAKLCMPGLVQCRASLFGSCSFHGQVYFPRDGDPYGLPVTEDSPKLSFPPLRYAKRPPAECGHYLRRDGVNMGCWFNKNQIILNLSFNVYINASNYSSRPVIRKSMNLQDLGMVSLKTKAQHGP